MAPLLQPLDKEIVKALVRWLRSATFQGTAALLAAVANTGAAGDARQADGLLRVRAARGFGGCWVL
jgi:hypothetical protein